MTLYIESLNHVLPKYGALSENKTKQSNLQLTMLNMSSEPSLKATMLTDVPISNDKNPQV